MSGLFKTLATCAALTQNPGTVSLKTQDQAVVKLQSCQAARQEYKQTLTGLTLTAREYEAIIRVTYAEAANQGDAGLTAVVFTILNRKISGRFGHSIIEIINAPNQFEPVTRAGGWHKLPKPNKRIYRTIASIITVAVGGQLSDPTNGALYFQNAQVVAAREQKGHVRKGLTHFGGSTPSAVIGDHSFYTQIHSTKPSVLPISAKRKRVLRTQTPSASWNMYANTFASRPLMEKASWDIFKK